MPNATLGAIVQIGEWRADPAIDTLTRGAETHKLEPRTMRLLLCLANEPGAVVSVDRLLADVWSGVIVGPASVYQAISQLRRLLGDVDANPTYIVNVPRKGYRLIAPVRRFDAPGGAALPQAGRSMAAAAVMGPAAAASESDAAPSAAAEPSEGDMAPAEHAGAEESSTMTTGTAATSPWHRRRMPILLGAAAVLACFLVGVLFWQKTALSGRGASSAASIVVLPFLDLTAEKSDQAFCDGLTEELSNWLAQIPTLRVVARTSAFAFRGKGEDVRQIGKALGTNHILEGSMRRSGDQLRITVQLIDARTGYHLWSENFDRPVADAIRVQEDISRLVAKTLQVRLTTESERQLAVRRSTDPQSYQMYLLGRHYAQQKTPEAMERAIDLYRQVLVADPTFVPAYTELARAELNQGYFHDTPVAEVAARVEPLVNSALRLDRSSSSAYAVRGALRAVQGRTQEALDDLAQATRLNSNEMSAFAEMGRIQLFAGQPRESIRNYDRAAALDPLNNTLQEQRCAVLDDLARYDEATAACERARVLQPEAASASDHLAWLAESRGHIEEALSWNAAALQAEPIDDFDLYWTRATLFLEIGLAAPARAAIELGRRSADSEQDANTALVRIVYRESGVKGLQDFMTATRLDESRTSVALFEAAYAELLLGHAGLVKGLLKRAIAAPDYLPGFAEYPYYARGERAVGLSYRIDLATAELMIGERASAERELSSVHDMLDRMIAAGVERNATYELRAKVFALDGHGDAAMRDLGRAARLGWRRAWTAVHEPYFASLQPRADFQSLMDQINRSNAQLAERLKLDQ